MKRSYGAQISIRGRFSSTIYEEIQIFLPDAQIFKESKKERPRSHDRKNDKNTTRKSCSRKIKPMKLIGEIINLLMFLIFLITIFSERSSLGVLFAFLVGVYLIHRVLRRFRKLKEV